MALVSRQRSLVESYDPLPEPPESRNLLEPDDPPPGLLAPAPRPPLPRFAQAMLDLANERALGRTRSLLEPDDGPVMKPDFNLLTGEMSPAYRALVREARQRAEQLRAEQARLRAEAETASTTSDERADRSAGGSKLSATARAPLASDTESATTRSADRPPGNLLADNNEGGADGPEDRVQLAGPAQAKSKNDPAAGLKTPTEPNRNFYPHPWEAETDDLTGSGTYRVPKRIVDGWNNDTGNRNYQMYLYEQPGGKERLFGVFVGREGWREGEIENLVPPLETMELRQGDRQGDGAFGTSRDGGKRPHTGDDYKSTPGEVVVAPVAGIITIYRNFGGKPDLKAVAIEAADGKTYVLGYVEPGQIYRDRDGQTYTVPTIRGGMRIEQGQAIGTAQDVSKYYPGITNHIHVQVEKSSVQSLSIGGREIRSQKDYYDTRPLRQHFMPRSQR